MKSQKRIPAPVQAAGGIVVRAAPEPLIALVRLRKNKAWVLPKGKLKPDEDALAAAKREAREETGHDVSVHEYLGEMPQAEGARPKTVRFWRMQATDKPTRKLMRDVKAVKWLPLDQAIATLTHAHERAFLQRVGPATLQAAAQARRQVPTAAGPAIIPFIQRIRGWLRRLTGRH
jgi:8-oxo-dGTP diphosphatase